MKKLLWRLVISSIFFVSAIILNNSQLKLIMFAISYILAGSDVVKRAIYNIKDGEVFDENFLMSIASIGAFLIGEAPEGVAVMLFYQVGELFQSYAVGQSRRSISSLMDIRPDYANVLRNGEVVTISPEEVEIGEIIVIKAGERVPLDGVVVEGNSMLDTSALTGESIPREVILGSELLSGCININGLLSAKVTKLYSESTVNKILELVENASSRKSKSEKFITRFARIYTPVVVVIAVILAIIPPLIIKDATFNEWIYRSLAFLVVSCPCALVISVPLSFFGGIGGASKNGILVKGSNYLEAMAKTEIIVFDKTGTLTKGVFKVQKIHSEKVQPEELLKLAVYAESYSNHPISASLKEAYKKDIDIQKISQVEEISGHGVSAVVENIKVLAGNDKLMEKFKIPYNRETPEGTIVHIAADGEYAGYIMIADQVKDDASEAVSVLKKHNIKDIVMLTGDSETAGINTAAELGIDRVYSELLPADKVEKVEELISQKSEKGTLMFVGDGINDAPVLARADVGVAMGALGSDAAIEAADVVIMTDELSKIASAIEISKNTLKIAYQNIIFAISVKVIILILSTFGLTSLWAAVFADVGVTFIAVLNAMRALRLNN
ncbi:MAG: heavy metal translocating P-type ATPase [Tissierellia bacterium]|jgi:Cd2+/Zn2+-exporting ATPase|nr:heavy metal translocating P-type ATPase [Tissierellia bacterium]MDD3226509.1 heavy metal translocating P-type ATPase [Tissierellia bacterium]MDD3750787.1 heavy metal translocating P-type ATPase [Tissierellia bacterium]MDD4046346.1 heavy metal translocating P-type ATPase [Tissierellia bacterium]MDD4678152.1 heavy metal translocating P-type ATPase [Tissierellia bacterium]